MSLRIGFRVPTNITSGTCLNGLFFADAVGFPPCMTGCVRWEIPVPILQACRGGWEPPGLAVLKKIRRRGTGFRSATPPEHEWYQTHGEPGTWRGLLLFRSPATLPVFTAISRPVYAAIVVVLYSVHHDAQHGSNRCHVGATLCNPCNACGDFALDARNRTNDIFVNKLRLPV